MKFDFWFELPKALSNVNQENLCQEDIEYGRIINQTLQDYNKAFDSFTLYLQENEQKLNQIDLINLKEKLYSIEKEKVELLCKSIKFSTKLMSKIISIFDNYEKLKISENELLLKIKIFLKITRLVVQNSKNAMESCKSENEIKFFAMIYVFSEKIQSKLFKISNVIIKSTLMNKINTNKKEEIHQPIFELHNLSGI